MKVVVLGAGIVGVTTAYYLAERGCEVTVLDRREGVALETSRANAGLIVPSQAPHWNEPGVPLRALKWLFDEHGALVIRARLDPVMWGWLLRFAWHSERRRFLAHARATLRLALYSREQLRTLREKITLDYDATTRGVLTIARGPGASRGFGGLARLLDTLGIAYARIDRDECLAHEPALNPIGDQIDGGLHTGDDESGDVHLLTTAIARQAQANGVVFRTHCMVREFFTDGDRMVAVGTSDGRVRADAFVLALGEASARHAARLGIRLPIYPVQGCSLTFDASHWDGRPSMPVRDRALQAVVTPLGDRVRVAGMAILNGGDLTIDPNHLARLERALRILYPNLPAGLNGDAWTGLRPMTPDGPPLLGATRLRNLYLNTGHGALGLTLACGSAAVVADLVAGRQPEIDLTGLTLARFG